MEPQNTPSLRLQEKAGFLEKPFENFNHLQNEGRIMLECELPLPFAVIPATADEACFVFSLYAQNRTALHAGSITLSEWRELLACGDADEAHFLICTGAMPAAYMKLNGLLNTDTAYLSMLFVAKRHQRRNLPFCGRIRGTLLAARGSAAVGVQTTADNLPAQALYKACGYSDVSVPKLNGDGL
ncbi:MAG: GNAT family N-acetyltransferase [Acutalibacteraceae bacterium]